MRIPKSLDIGGQIYTVKIYSFGDSSREWSGETMVADNLILIAEDLSQTQKESTLLHEIIEVLNEQHEYKMPHSVIQSLEAALFQVLKTNKIMR